MAGLLQAGLVGRVLDGRLKRKVAMTGEVVPQLKQIVSAKRLDVDVDGGSGPQTETAVRARQSASSLNGDGVVGAATASLLNR